jgi:lipopolysaccharide assembly protein A
MRVVYWVAILAIAAVLSVFAASNRDPVSLGLWPLPFLVGTPLYLVVFGALFAGFLAGLFAAWIGGSHRRREFRRCRRRSEALARELAATQSQLSTQPRQAGAALPATR